MNVIWLIFAIFFPIILYYVMLKLALAVDHHVRHKKEVYSLLKVNGNGVLKEFNVFPTNTMVYYWLYLISGGALFVIDFYYPLNLQTLSIPTPTLTALIINFFFLVVLTDVISKRFYVHQEMENEINESLADIRGEKHFKKRSGFGFMALSFLTVGIYIYIYLFLVNKEYINHVVYDYETLKKLPANEQD